MSLAFGLLPLWVSVAHADRGLVLEEAFLTVAQLGVEPGPSGSRAKKPSPQASMPPKHESFQSYDSAKNALNQHMRSARSRIMLVTHSLGDGEIATTVHSMKLRGIGTLIVLDRKARNRYNSRHHYLAKAGVTVYFTNLGKVVPKSTSLAIIDDHAIEFGSPFEKGTSTPVAMGPSRYTTEELVKAINSGGPLDRVLEAGAPASPPRAGAKAPTRSAGSKIPKSGNLTDGVMLRARSTESSGGAIPRTLPRKTRVGEILSGAREHDGPVVPIRTVREESLRLDNEGELRPD